MVGIEIPTGDENSLMQRKMELRELYLEKRKNQNSDAVLSASHRVCQQLSKLNPLTSVNTICGYRALGNEIDLLEYYNLQLKAGKHLYFPRFDEAKDQYVLTEITSLAQFESGKHNVLEPFANLPTISQEEARQKIDVWFVPGVLFDKFGHRLGRGVGSFDRILENAEGLKVGIADTYQVLSGNIPVEHHDVPLELLVTPEQVYSFLWAH